MRRSFKSIIFCLSVLSSLTTYSQSYEIVNNGKDTLNMIDKSGKKQGKWITYGKNKPGTCYQANQKIDEGKYQDNRKQGNWMEYYCNGNLKNQITFLNGRPNGFSVMYYENGNKKEEGMWSINKWVGNYSSYYENGQVQHSFKYNSAGRRDGYQSYYYENGELALEGNFVNGREEGLFKEYYDNGDRKGYKEFNGGNVNTASIETFEPKKPLYVFEKEEKLAPAKSETVVKKDEEENIKTTASVSKILNGKHILYNKNKQISKDGLFKNNRLMEGKAYIYNENGILTRVAIYKNGIYVGDGTIEN
ncbi:MAG: toxin-antitoxin system YwqK family antitoxin [Bacteroidia bacterium]